MKYLILLIMVILYSFQSLFCRLYTSSRNGEGGLQFSVLYSGLIGVVTFMVNGFHYSPCQMTLLLGLINGGIDLLYNISMVKAGNLGSYAFMMIGVLSGGILVPMVYDSIYLGTAFNFLQILAVVLMLASFVLMNLDGIREIMGRGSAVAVSDEKASRKRKMYFIWVAILFFANGFYGIMMNLHQQLVGKETSLNNEMIMTTFLGVSIITCIVNLLTNRKSFVAGFKMSKKTWLFLACSAASATAAVILMMYAMARPDILYTELNVVDNGGVLVVSSLFALTLFKEKAKPSTILGMLLATASIVILSL